MGKKFFLASASVQRKRMLAEAGIDFICVGHTADERSCPWESGLEELTQRLAQLKMTHVVLPAGMQDGDMCFVLTADTLTMVAPEHGLRYYFEDEITQPERIISIAHPDASQACPTKPLAPLFELRKTGWRRWAKLPASLKLRRTSQRSLGPVEGAKLGGEPSTIIGKPKDHADAIAIVKQVRDGVLCGTGFCIERRAWDGTNWHTQQQYIGYAQGWCSLAITDDEIEDYFVQLKKQSGFNYLALAGGFSITGYGAQFLKEVHGSYPAILGLPMAEVREGLKELGFFSL